MTDVSLKNVLISIITAIDLHSFLLKNHHRRTSIIAYQLGISLGLEIDELKQLVIAASIHDIGALYVTERDELLKVDVEDPEAHEIMGASIVGEFKPFEEISKIIRHHHIKYDDIVNGIINSSEVKDQCFILHLADRIDVLLDGKEADEDHQKFVIDEINKRFGTIFDPELKDVFNKIAKTEEFWDNISMQSYYDLLCKSLDTEYFPLDEVDIEDLARLFARMVDQRSKWTVKHSLLVGHVAYRIGELLELPVEVCFELKIAGYLHDIGKIGIPVEMLDKTGKLDKSEFKVVKKHALYSSLILRDIQGLEDVASWAVNHHEKRDGTGYPMHLDGGKFRIEMDIIAYADIFSALIEDRPYRKGMNKQETLEILAEQAKGKLDEKIYNMIVKNFDELYSLLEI